MLGNYGTPQVALVSGQGATVVDADGKEYLDFLAGIAVNSLGHAHPAVVEAVSRQASELMHVSNLAIHPRGIELAEKLRELSGWDARVFFSQDGATANEAALKVARRYGYGIAPDGSKQRVVAMQGSFHGRTMGALAVTGNSAKRDPFAPPAGFLARARALATLHEALLIVDEVQSGVGRTGDWFACRSQGVVPDIMTLAKGLGGGMPIGAMLVNGKAQTSMVLGDHGTTFGGNPVSCAAALAVIETIEQEGILANVKVLGAALRSRIVGLRSPRITEVRGIGLWVGVVFDTPIAPGIEGALREAGVLVNAAKPNVLRIAPPLNVTDAQVQQFVEALEMALRDLP